MHLHSSLAFSQDDPLTEYQWKLDLEIHANAFEKIMADTTASVHSFFTGKQIDTLSKFGRYTWDTETQSPGSMTYCHPFAAVGLINTHVTKHIQKASAFFFLIFNRHCTYCLPTSFYLSLHPTRCSRAGLSQHSQSTRHSKSPRLL